MADDGDVSNRKPKRQHRPQETFHAAQETPAEHRFPNTTGIIPLPAGSRGPKSLYLKRNGDSFGFTLRHFIVYPPDSIAESDGRHAAVGALSAPMDTIFVKHVKDRSPAKLAGLQCGDRLLRVNRVPVTDKTYAEVVQLIQKSPDYLHLLVVPKEDDILQRYFAETAYNPASNQQPQPPPRLLTDRQAAQHFLTQTFNRQLPKKFQVDAISWRSLQNSYGYDYRPAVYDFGQQRSAENLDLRERVHPQHYPDDSVRKARPRAQPQVPLYKKTGRRASEGCALSDRDYYYEQPELSSDYDDMVVNNSKMKAMMHKTNYLPENQSQDLRYPNSAGCRLSLDAGRRESSSSLTSSLADGSKDSLFDSTSTLTGHETDDSARMSRFRKSQQQKEEFLKMPLDSNVIQREFYSRPKKLEKAMWPPPERQESPSRGTAKPTHQNFQRVKNDIEIERDLLGQSGGVAANNLPQQKGAKSPKDKTFDDGADRIKEASTAPTNLDNVEQFNGAHTAEEDDEKRMYPASLQMVHKRARQFESGKPLPEDDPILSNRTSFYRSELARISSKRVVPNVTELAQEFETRSGEARKEPPPSTTTTTKKVQRDSRSLESSGSSSSSSSLTEVIAKRLSGNVMISTGSKYIHCPPPSEYGKPTDTSENQAITIRARSNSAESWAAALPEKKSETSSNNKRISRQDAIIDDGNKTKDDHQTTEVPGEIPYADLPPLIPEPVEQMQFTPSVSVTPASPPVTIPAPTKAVRPNQLDLEGPTRPSRHLKPPTSNIDTPIRRPVSPADDERSTRRESYLKATEGGRMHFDSDLSDGDVSPQVLRSGSVSGNSSSSASLDREKVNASPLEKDKHVVIREGPLNCKITEIDGKRFGDRSWKQIWAALKGPKLFLHKDKHHQSPMGTSDVVEHSLASGVDMRASEVRVAEDYTKRKHVLRVSSVNPCRSEFLLQADNTDEFTDWFKALQEQMATNTEAEAKFDPLTGSKQQAVPQTVPASTSILVPGSSSRLSPQPSKSKSASTRNRSPTGQSPVSKTRKPSQVADPSSTSPRGKTWRNRVVKRFTRFGGSSPSSPTAPEGSTFGVPLDQCLTSENNPYVPKFVEICTDIVDARGLQTVGIYRVPGNNASITALTEEVNRNYDMVPVNDPRWNDLHVVSSLLKAYFRKIPDSLVTSALYPSFIKADKIENAELRMKELKRLVKSLPPHNYHTLKHIILHLKKVVDNADVNKMEAKNLAIVFGPNIVRPEDDNNMETMVNNMTHQCKIVETFLTCADWFFSDDSDAVPVPAIVPDAQEESEAGNQALLLDNISKYEAAFKDKEKNGALFSSIISAAQRKVKRKTTKGAGSLSESKEEVISPNEGGIYSSAPHIHSDLKESTTTDGKGVIPTTVQEMEKANKPLSDKLWFNYSTDAEDFYRRVENFKQETEAMLKKPRKTEISVNDIVSKSSSLSSSAGSVNNQSTTTTTTTTTNRLSTKPVDSQLLKTHSASNVFARTMINVDNNSRHSLDNSYSVQYANNKNAENGSDFGGSLHYAGRDANRNVESVNSAYYGAYLQTNTNKAGGGDARFLMRRGSSVENINSSPVDLNANGSMKKVKYENEGDIGQRVGSLDSLNKMVPLDDDTDLVTTMTTLYDKLLEKEHSRENLLEGKDLPYADESPEKTHRLLIASNSDKENVPNLHDLYRNPSLHKNQFRREGEVKDADKDEDSTMTHDSVLEKEKHVSHKLAANNKNRNLSPGSKLKRSESLNKPEKTVSPLNNKLKRSESLNKTGDKLKRSDSLTKNEKTESNLNKRRELASSIRKSKEVIKLKRKNGMPDRSIKRRHTVGGTKDPDKVTWLDNKYQETSSNKENKEKNLRTSSPDLSSTRRERLCFEINLIGPENMVVALKQHLMGARPQSFPDTTVFKVPLESHV